MKRFIFLLIFYSVIAPAWANHSIGGEITYRYIDSLKYEITAIYYRDCSATPLLKDRIDLILSCGNQYIDTIDATPHSIVDITPVCSTESKRCSPANQRSGEGLEKHTFRDTIDFNLAKYSALKNCSGKIRIASSLCCRPTAIGVSNSYYNYAEIDLNKAKENSSPIFTSEARMFLCCNQPVYYNFGASDTIDFDSLSYAWAYPEKGPNTIIPYTGSYSLSHPFKAFYPIGRNPPYFNINANPPVGIYLDPETGDLIFTPTRCDEITIAVIQVTEWRKDSNDIYQEIGVTRRDLQYITRTCPDNNPPEIKGPFNYNVCEGSTLCFDVQTDDDQFIPQPPAQPRKPDTVTNTWNRGIPGATYTIINPTDRLQTGRFCWIPEEGMARSLPYQFTVTARDQACPLNSISSRGFRVRVKPRAKSVNRSFEKKSCNWYEINSELDSNFQGTPSFSWTILDSLGNLVIDKYTASFKSTNSFISRKQKDSIRFLKSGKYIIQHDINNLPLNCPNTYFDTLEIEVDNPSYVKIGFADTSICPGVDFSIEAEAFGSSASRKFQWYRNDSLLVNDTTTLLQLTDVTVNETERYKLTFTDQLGCKSSDQFIIKNHVPNIVNFGKIDKKCTGDSIVLKIDSSFNSVSWNPVRASSYEPAFFTSTDVTVIYKDSNGCAGSTSTRLEFLPLPQGSLNDTFFCHSNGSLYAGVASSYKWSTGEFLPRISVRSSGLYTAELTDSLGCKNVDSAFVSIYTPRIVRLPNDVKTCDSFRVVMDDIGSYLWSNGNTRSEVLIENSQELSVIYTDSNGCVSRDTMTLEILETDKVDLADSTVSCGPYEYTLKPSGSYRWSNGSIRNTALIDNTGEIWVRYTDSSGCSSRDTGHIQIVTTPTPVISETKKTLYSDQKGYHIWFRNNQEISGENRDSLEISSSGLYKSIYVDQYGCESDTSNVISYTLGLTTIEDHNLNIYPNPTTGVIHLNTEYLSDIKALRVYNQHGQLIKHFSESKDFNEVVIDGEAGIYTIEIETLSHRLRARIIKL